MKHGLICAIIALQNITQHHGRIDTFQCLIASRFVELVFSQNWHPSELEILLELFVHCHIGCKLVEVQKLLEGQRQHPYLYISAGEQRRKFRGQQIGIGTRDINVYIIIQAEGLDCYFPMLYSLQFIEYKVGLSVFSDLLADIIIKRKVIV